MKTRFRTGTAVKPESNDSPSPCPSPSGRGRIALGVFGQRGAKFGRRAPEFQRMPTRCPLSQRERARVRERTRTFLDRRNFLPIKAQI